MNRFPVCLAQLQVSTAVCNISSTDRVHAGQNVAGPDSKLQRGFQRLFNDHSVQSLLSPAEPLTSYSC